MHLIIIEEASKSISQRRKMTKTISQSMRHVCVKYFWWRWLWLKSLACHMPLLFRWDGVGPVAHYDVGHGIGIGEGILVVVEVKEALIVVMVLLHLMVVVIGVLRYMCVVQCLGSWTLSVALGILSDSTVTPSAVKISDLHIFHRWKSDVLNIPLSNSCPVNDSFCIVPSTRYINLHFAWSDHLYSDSFLEN